jgi:cytochrome P450
MGGIADDITLDELERDPYPWFRRLRDEQPVAFVPSLDLWLVTRWDDVVEVASTPDRFRSNTEPSWLRQCLGENMLTLDGADHDRLADGMRPPFVAATCPRAVGAGLADLIDETIDELPARAPIDLMTAFAEPVANRALAAALQWTVDWRDLARWCRGVCTGIANFDNDPQRAAVAAIAHDELAASIEVAVERGEIAGGFTGDFSLDEIIGNVRLMVSGGINEPREGFGLVMWVLLQRPALLDTVRADPAALRRVIEETMRWMSPVGTATRQAVTDVEVGGTRIPQGAMVAACLSAANRDPVHWPNADEFDPDRRDGAHLAFAVGEHRCLGEWLGRQQIRVGVQRLLERVPRMRLAAPVELHGFEFRGPTSVMVEW